MADDTDTDTDVDSILDNLNEGFDDADGREAEQDDEGQETGDDEGQESPDDAEGDAGQEDEKPVKHKPSRAEKRIKELLAANKAAQERERQMAERLHRLEQSYAEQNNRSKFDVLTSRYEQAVKAGDDAAIKQARQDLADYKPETPAPPPQVDAQPTVSDAASDWIDRNPWFNSDPAKARAAMAYEQALVAEGYSVDDPALYARLDEMMGKKPVIQKRRPAGIGDPGNPGSDGSNKPRLTQDDLNMMRLLGENPDDPAVRKAWLQQKKAG